MLELANLTGSDLARLSAEFTAIVGVELVVGAVPVGAHKILPGEMIRYL